jgi:hypothetical protein
MGTTASLLFSGAAGATRPAIRSGAGSIGHHGAGGNKRGMTRHYYVITFGERYIWGVTAGIMRNLHERIYR